MKKIYLTLLGTIFALGASAQFEWNIRSGEWQVDSMYTIDKETGERMVTDVYEYNSDGTLAVMYSDSQDYDYLYNDYVTERTKSVFTYDNGRLTLVETFWLKGNDWVIMAKTEMSDHDALGNPRTVIHYEADDDDEGQMLMTTKWEVTRWGTYEPADYKLYQIDFGTWELYNTTVSELNEEGLVIKQTHTSTLFGTESVSTDTYEYDEHGYVTKQESTSDFGTHVDTYVNIYDANGNIQTVTLFDDGQEDETDYYFWSRGGKTAIRSAKMHDSPSSWFDLGGRRLNAAPARKGLFIQNGKKVYNK